MKIYGYAGIFLVLFGRSTAQTPLGLEEALRLAQQNNLQIKKQQQKQRIAELEVSVKRGQRLPSLDANAAFWYRTELAKFDLPFSPVAGQQTQIALGGRDITDLAVGITQPLFTGFRLNTQVTLAQATLESENVRLALLNQQMMFQVYLLFYQSQILQKEGQIQTASLTRLSVQLDQTRQLFFAAQAMAYDTLQVYNQELQIKILLEQNQRDQRLAELQMARLLDLPESRSIVELELAPPPEWRPSLDSLKQVAYQQRPELSSVRIGQRAAQLNRKLAASNYFPEIGAEAKYHYGKPALNQVANQWMDYFSFGVSLQWNLWRWNQDRHRAQEAETEYTRLTLEERELLRTIDYEVEKSLENLTFAVKQVRLAQSLLSQQRDRYRIVSVQQREGLATTNDVIVAEADLTQAELQVQRALIQYYISQSEMKLATGAIGE